MDTLYNHLGTSTLLGQTQTFNFQGQCHCPFNFSRLSLLQTCVVTTNHSHNNVAADAAEALDKTGKVMSSYGPYIGGRHSGSNAYNNDTNQDNTR